MSEEIDIQSSHLCTTEDAFEQFQSNSMYEEDEFITLSDIVPPQPDASDVTLDLNNISFENEVVRDIALEEQVPEVNSTIEISSENNNLVEQPVESNALEEDIQQVPPVSPDKTQTKRRGRKKSQYSVESGFDKQNEETFKKTSEQVGLLSSEPTPKRKRGRPPKKVRKYLEDSLTDDYLSNGDTEHMSKKQSLEVVDNELPPKTKRGRPRKVVTEENNVNSYEPPQQQDSNLIKDISPSSDKKSQSKGKSRNAIELEEKHSNIPDNQSLNQSTVNETINKSPGKRRGRPKKKCNIELDKAQVDNCKVNVSIEVPKEGDDDGDDICLSELKSHAKSEEQCIKISDNHTVLENKDTLAIVENTDTTACVEKNLKEKENINDSETVNKLDNPTEEAIKVDETLCKGNSIKPEMTDFELNIDNIVKNHDKNESKLENEINNSEPTDSLLVEDTSKRPVRRKARLTLHYDDGSDEDPFANVELSDDENRTCKKGRYYSDDEYIPEGLGKHSSKQTKESDLDSSDSDIDSNVDEFKTNKRKRCKKADNSPSKPYKKRGRKPKGENDKNKSCVSHDITANDTGDDDVQICEESTFTKKNDTSKNVWGTTNEFENFLAKRIHGTDIKIKKSSTPVVPLEIPIIDPNELKKSSDIATQTKVIAISSKTCQTSSPYDIPMKSNVPLSAEQSEKACEFLRGIVKTTAELGELMTQKSQDFIKKKINTSHVTDAFKMDYCVKKSFLLFKLAKHNLLQMEEDLAQQYEDFLNSQSLSHCREEQKVLTAEEKGKDSDSDCEIIETPETSQKPKSAAAFNPKTVFLNKELSIKIAKKPCDKKLNIKGSNTIWINQSVMVKKVKPTQSFLAQDSRNKKPPDNITIEMVSAFFKQYYRERAVVTCAPFVSSEWLATERVYACHYFIASSEDYPKAGIPSGSSSWETTESNITVSEVNNDTIETLSPRSLFCLCYQALKVYLSHADNNNKITLLNAEDAPALNPVTLYRMCINMLNTHDINCKSEKIQSLCKMDTLAKMECHVEPSILFCEDILSLSNEIAPSITFSPLPLYELCINIINKIILDSKKQNDKIYPDKVIIPSLQTICQKKVNDLLYFVGQPKNRHKYALYKQDILESSPTKTKVELKFTLNNGMKSLFSLCSDFIQKQFTCNIRMSPSSLKYISYKYIVKILFEKEQKVFLKHSKIPEENKRLRKNVNTLANLCFEIVKKLVSNSGHDNVEGLTINSVNTLTEEAYHNIELSGNAGNYYEDDDNFYDNVTETDFNENGEPDDVENSVDDNGWLSQVQMQVSSCFNEAVLENSEQEQNPTTLENESVTARIKIEPEDETLDDEVDASIVKTEPLHHLDEMTTIPEGTIIPKSEYDGTPSSSRPHLDRQSSSSYDVDTFESFVRTNKMMHSMDNHLSDDEGLYSQSAQRIRRQFEPDLQFDSENDINMSLLVPHTSMPLIGKEHKDILMESSSDEICVKKTSTKKKAEKRVRNKIRKNEPKSTSTKHDLQKYKIPVLGDIAMLTRRMRDKIRQEEKNNVSSESETETENLVSKKGKDKSKDKNNKDKANSNEVEMDRQPHEDTEKSKLAKNDKDDNEIQCSNVDSTGNDANDLSSSFQNEEVRKLTPSPCTNNFTGFSPVDQNETVSYHKYAKYVYEQILPKHIESEKSVSKENKEVFFDPEEPAEVLECEPNLLFVLEANSSETTEPKSELKKIERVTNNNDLIEKDEKPLYIERHGWKCFPLTSSDTKLYQNPQIILEKLPESFVKTYFKYQHITEKSKEDEEVDRLVNLQTLSKTIPKGDKSKGRPKSKLSPQYLVPEITEGQGSNESENDNLVRSGSASPTNTEQYDELTPSEDEGSPENDNYSQPAAISSTENNLAKNSLMDDNVSEDEGHHKIKKEPKDSETESLAEVPSKNVKKYKPCPKSKKVKDPELDAAPVMLTADKMMNKELNLLHAPVNLDEEIEDVIKPSRKGPVTRKQKTSGKTPPKNCVQVENDSSSEEEKQWFTIKEKLLKKMVKKIDTSREDDAKRAKLVSEFIERRGDGTESYIKKRRGAVRGRRSKKKMLERQKQLKVLTRELFGDPSNDASLQKKSKGATYFKGRRNIRKVLNKKSLAENTVIANMEEFERKRRLNMRQSKLREVLRCEEDVNVLVINDEVCLEYDFEQHRPVVTIHSFFTKVMKAHQYEGVKFMWDACFESLESIASGHRGSGCILAHCMGLGKTLQVLALLHTVLTHPGVGMQRVLVCCPLSTVLNWVDEIHKWIGPVTKQIKVFELSKLRKTYERAYQLEDWYNGGGIFIIGYELFRSLTTLDPFLDDVRPTIVNKIRTALLDPGPDMIICDEGHLLKNDCSVLAVAMSRVATQRRIVLTGTPMQNNLREYYCMVNFVKPNLLGTYAEYSNRFENPIMNGQHRDSQEEDIKLMKARTHILHKVLEGCLQRQEASVMYPYLPKKYEYTIFVSLTKCQWDLYKHYLRNYGKTLNNKSVLKDFHVLQKIWSHPQVLHNFQTRLCDDAKARNKVKVEKLEDDLAREDLNATEDIKPSDTEVWWLQYLDGGEMLDSLASSNKFFTIFRILDESVALGDKVLIFSTSLFTMDSLEYFLKKINKWSLGQEYYRLDGSVPAEVRQKWCREFNAENNHKTKLFLISTRAGSLGLNMTAANRVIILDTSWNPAHDIQSIFRVYRFGQKKDCFIYRLVALGTMEQKIYERSVTKQAVACRVVDEQQIDRHYNMADLTELYKYDECGGGVAGGVAAGVRDVVVLRVARDAALHGVHEHDSLLRAREPALPEHERAAAWRQFRAKLQGQVPDEKKEGPDDAVKPYSVKENTKLKAVPKIEKTENSNIPETSIAIPTPKRRGRKKKSEVKCDLPIQSGDKEEDDGDKEKVMVKRISEILVQHNFQNRQTPEEIAALVARVRNIVSSGDIEKLDSSDALTMSIANVLLNKNIDNGRRAMPALTDISCDQTVPAPSDIKDENDTEPASKAETKSVKEKAKKGYVYITIPPAETTVATPKLASTEQGTKGRSRRKAALEAERNFDAIVESIIEVDDDEWQNDSDHEFTPLSQIKQAREQKQESTPQVSKKKKNSMNIEEKVQNSNNESVCTNDSILIDDDEPPPRRRPGRPRKRKTSDEVSAIPLHPSLLSNGNFIRIVAYTYLKDNPMLDNNAATLAAQYSTFKALKEFESTGEPIKDGPIYNIAVKELGMEVIKKLQITKMDMQISEMIASHPLFARNEPAEPTEPGPSSSKPGPASSKPGPASSKPGSSYSKPMPSSSNPEPSSPKPGPSYTRPGPASKKQRPTILKRKPTSSNPEPSPGAAVLSREPVRMKIKIPPLPANLAAASAAPEKSSHANVVPVGLFKGAEGNGAVTADECILPDDDDVCIVSDPIPVRRDAMTLIITPDQVPQPSTATPTVKKPELIGETAKRMIMNSVRVYTKSSASATPKTPPAPITPAPVVQEANTISLDSDDEDIIVPHSTTSTPQPANRKIKVYPVTSAKEKNKKTVPGVDSGSAPVPISLTKVHLSAQELQQILHVDTNATPNSTNNPTKKELLNTLLGLREQGTKRVCDDGDIYQISDDGVVRMLNRVDPKQPSQTSTAVATPAVTPEPSKVEKEAAQEINKSKKTTIIKKIGAISKAGNDDTLSIFRDVVHIEAATNVRTNVNTKQTPTSSKIDTSKNKPFEKKSKIDQSGSVQKSSAHPTSHTVLNSILIKNRAIAKASEKKEAAVEVKKSVNPKVKMCVVQTKKTQRPLKNRTQVVDLVDLTDMSAGQPKAKRTSITESPKVLKTASTVVGTSKSIILCGSGKVNIAPNADLRDLVGKKLKVDLATPKSNVQIMKRPAQADATPAKKLKTDKPMTLKDFVIDDIDDIIELE